MWAGVWISSVAMAGKVPLVIVVLASIGTLVVLFGVRTLRADPTSGVDAEDPGRLRLPGNPPYPPFFKGGNLTPRVLATLQTGSNGGAQEPCDAKVKEM